MEDDNIVTVSEVNKAEEAYERAVDEYEQAKLTLQQTELDSLKDEWHITVETTRLYESADGRELFSITLRNSSSPVKLVESSKVLGREIIISAQIDDIFVAIKEQEGYGTSGATITEPYEQRIETLKEGESVTLEFELIKENVRDVVVELTYSGEVDEKNIHLKQEYPYISVVSARRYKEGDRRRLEVVLIYGALKSETEEQEITQDAFLKAYQKLGTLKNPNAFVGWLYVIVARLCLDWLRKNRIPIESLDTIDSSAVNKGAYSQYVAEKQATEADETRREVVKELLKKLPESERTVITLHYLGEMTIKAVSEFLGVSPNTVKSRLRRAHNRLKKEEGIIRENLSSFQLTNQLTENIMRDVSRLTPAAPATSKPMVPWAAVG